MSSKRKGLLAAGGVALIGAGAATGGPAPAAKPTSPSASAAQSDQGVSGRFSLIHMVHTRSSSFGNLPGTSPWNGSQRTTDAPTYRSIPCTGNAPVNNIASDLPSYGTRVRGSRAPSSMRVHPMGFRVRRNPRTRQWEILGQITFTVCHLRPGPTPQNDPVPDANKPKIRVGFRAAFKRESNEMARFRGRFRIVGGTQRYADLTGSGEIAGYFFCFAPEGCVAHQGNLLDGQFTMSGTYRDPTPNLAAEG
jgi:hypothetical protein